MSKLPKVVVDRMVREITDAYRDALNVVPHMRGREPQDVFGDEELQSAVLTAAMSAVATRPTVAATLAEALAPRKCQRPGCVNEATRREYGGPREPVWCSSACRAWARRMERRGARAGAAPVAVPVAA